MKLLLGRQIHLFRLMICGQIYTVLRPYMILLEMKVVSILYLSGLKTGKMSISEVTKSKLQLQVTDLTEVHGKTYQKSMLRLLF